MDARNQDVEQIVQLVIQRLRSAAGAAPVATPKSPAANASNTGSSLALAEQVVSLASLDGKLNRIRQLVVRDDAVVTPAVRDELRARKITLVRSGNGRPEKALATGTLWIGCAAPADLRTTVCQKLTGLAAAVQVLEGSELRGLVEQLQQRLQSTGHYGLVVTQQAPVAACLANRHPHVRAAVAQTPAEIDDARKMLGVNLLVLDPSGMPQNKLLEMAVQFAQAGPAGAPQWMTTR